MTGRGERRRRADIVRYWRSVEMFSPQKVDPVSPPKDVYAVDAGKPLPWERGHPVREKPLARNAGKMTWQHTVYCGVYEVAAVRDVLLDVFGGSEEDHDGRIDGDTALLSFEVTDDGLLVQDSLTFSACAWATGRARKPGPDTQGWLDGFEDQTAECERVVLGVGDGKLTIVDRASGRLRPFAGLACEITLGAVTGGLSPALEPLLGDIAAGAVTGAVDSASEELLPRLGLGERGREDDGQNGQNGQSGEDDSDDAPLLGTKPLTVRDLSAVTRWVADQFGVTDELRPQAVRVRSRQVSRSNAGKAAGSDFLNSFIATDLALVADKLATEEPRPALRDYLTATEAVRTAERVDLRKAPGAVLRGVEPERIPLGRWPAKTTHPLVLSQQFAVNAILEQLADSEGLYSVNGPPGTGKTTQLRDLIAGVLVLRAEKLAQLATPQDAFTGKALRWSTGNYQRSVRALKPELTGYEIVIASANNGAVENVSVEIPARASVDDEWHEEAAYFPEQGQLILGGKPAWGAVAAKLGNKSNRRDFRNDYWFGRTESATEDGTLPGVGMRELLKWAASPMTSPGTSSGSSSGRAQSWPEAVGTFREARRAVYALREERQRAARALTDLAGSEEELAQAQRQVDTASGELSDHRVSLAEARARLDSAQAHLTNRTNFRTQHRDRRPGLVAGLFTLGAAQRDWRAEDQELGHAEQSAREVYERHFAAVSGHETAERATLNELTRAEGQLRTVREKARRAQRIVDQVREQWGTRLPGEEERTGRTPSDARELSSPWADPEFTRARTRLFLTAMHLHRAFLEGAADRMRKNLDAAMDVLCGDAPKGLPAQTVLAAWQNLFLAVPVVSTTFASLDRMFTGLGPGSLGWVLIDEAGQATAQMPVGALWRARRAVIVGDPLQLEPVVTLPHTGQQALRRTLGVAEEWAPARTSAQRVADRLNRYGTWLPAPDGAEDGHVWVGSPLRVHRRCGDPMFRVSNEIAYEGMMVHGVNRDDDYAIASRSVWWHVSGGATEGKWSPDEGDAANVIVHRLFDQGLAPHGLFVVSPFRDVVTGLKRGLCQAVPRDRIGTVHTTQGKEADVVLLVLGSGGRNSGPRTWAASTPNLLNVAVSRARRRLFVVGDHDSWSRDRYFDTLAQHLPRMADAEMTAMRTISPPRLPHPCRCRR